jgi:hypothetical protein
VTAWAAGPSAGHGREFFFEALAGDPHRDRPALTPADWPWQRHGSAASAPPGTVVARTSVRVVR